MRSRPPGLTWSCWGRRGGSGACAAASSSGRRISRDTWSTCAQPELWLNKGYSIEKELRHQAKKGEAMKCPKRINLAILAYLEEFWSIRNVQMWLSFIFLSKVVKYGQIRQLVWHIFGVTFGLLVCVVCVPPNDWLIVLPAWSDRDGPAALGPSRRPPCTGCTSSGPRCRRGRAARPSPRRPPTWPPSWWRLGVPTWQRPRYLNLPPNLKWMPRFRQRQRPRTWPCSWPPPRMKICPSSPWRACSTWTAGSSQLRASPCASWTRCWTQSAGRTARTSGSQFNGSIEISLDKHS